MFSGFYFLSLFITIRAVLAKFWTKKSLLIEDSKWDTGGLLSQCYLALISPFFLVIHGHIPSAPPSFCKIIVMQFIMLNTSSFHFSSTLLKVCFPSTVIEDTTATKSPKINIYFHQYTPYIFYCQTSLTAIQYP